MKYSNISPSKKGCWKGKQTTLIYDEDGRVFAQIFALRCKREDAVAMAKHISELLNKEAK